MISFGPHPFPYTESRHRVLASQKTQNIIKKMQVRLIKLFEILIAINVFLQQLLKGYDETQ